MKAYVSKIEAIAMQAVGNEELVRGEVEAILASGKFRSDFYKHSGLNRFLRRRLSRPTFDVWPQGFEFESRCPPMPGFHPTVYSWLQRRGDKAGGDPLVDFLGKGLPEGPWLQGVIQDEDNRKRTPNSGLRVAVHLHVFYQDQLAGTVERLKLNSSTPDLFISVDTKDAAKRRRKH